MIVTKTQMLMMPRGLKLTLAHLNLLCESNQLKYLQFRQVYFRQMAKKLQDLKQQISQQTF